ncbi:rhomboid family intramembrane serine protease [Metabacillus lacus]|nr:rhomboid family intramembrane serine protease [Metabacillus lacus]
MVINQDFLYWKIANQLVLQHGYRMIHISRDQREIWLEPRKKQEFDVIRLKREDADWSNLLLQDMNQAGHTFESIRKRTGRRSFKVFNLYITALPPVDDWEYIFESSKLVEKTTLINQLLHTENVSDEAESIQEALPLSLEELSADAGIDDVQAVKQELLHYTAKRNKEEREIFQHGRPLLTYVFIAIQLVMFYILESAGGSTNTDVLIRFGAKENTLLLNGEWWRLVAPVFLHIGFLHLMMNTLALLYIGGAVERMFGSRRFLFIYLLSGIAGTLASFAFSPFVSAGASGAIFGCFGALLYMGVSKPKLFFRTIGANILVVIAINIAIGFTIPNIDNAGHLGGLAGGFLASFIFQLPNQRKVFVRMAGILTTAALLLGLFAYGNGQFAGAGSAYTVSKGQELIQNGNYQEAYDLLKTNQTEASSNEHMTLLAISEIQLQKNEDARENLQSIIDRNASYDQAYFFLAILEAEESNFEEARNYLQQAIRLNPDDQRYQELKNSLPQ